MSITRILFSLAAVALLCIGTAVAQTAPPQPEYDGEFVTVDNTTVNPLRVTTQDISWNGSGSVAISFNISQRARVWAAVYEKGNNATGPVGEFGAVVRFQPQDLHVWHSADQIFESGNGTITWNGRDMDGNAVGAGSYEFDVMAWNNIDKAALAGPGGVNSFCDATIDLRQDPPEVFNHVYDRDRPANSIEHGDMYRSTLGTDYLANPTAVETWTFRDVMDFEGARSFGGLRADPDNMTRYFSSHHRGEGVGIYAMDINRAGKTWDRATDWGDNGYAAAPNLEGMWIAQVEPWEGMLVATNWSIAEVPASSVELYDKGSGAHMRSLDVSEFFQHERFDDDGASTGFFAGGPGTLSVDDSGIWLAGFGSKFQQKVDWDGNLIWLNQNGDDFGDKVTFAQEAETGMKAASSATIKINHDRHINGNVVYTSPRHNDTGHLYIAYGRDGTGLFKIQSDPANWMPEIPSLGTHIWFISDDGYSSGGTPLPGPNFGRPGPWDGFYTDMGANLATHERGNPEEVPFPPKMMFFTPVGSATGRLGAGVTAVEEVASFGTPDSYHLSDAYPNPFNPETTIEFDVPVDGRVAIDVYNAAGQLVKSLVNQDLNAGAYTSTWNGTAEDNQQVASGVYFYRMQAGDFTDTRAMTLLK